jgi:glycosyltransferase involved in cell wall biosynthesis
MGPQDGVDHLVRAVGHLVRDHGRTDLLCLIIGRGDALPDLKKLTAELGLESYIEFPGRVSDEELMRLLSTVDVCVDPDPSNPFNDRCTMIKISEYMALGRPIVAYDLPEHRVTAQEAAVYATPNDPAALAAAIDGLLSDPDRRGEMAEIGRARVLEVLAWNHQQPHLLEAYRRLIGPPVEESTYR